MTDYNFIDTPSEETQKQHTDQRIELGEHWAGDPTILNPDEFIEAAENLDAGISPEGNELQFKIKKPNLNGDPWHLLVEAPRKGFVFRLVNLAHEWGLVVSDSWQHDIDKGKDVVCLLLKPVEATDLLEDENP